MHKHQGRYYLSYSTGDTHFLCYAVSDDPYGPFTYQGQILTPVGASRGFPATEWTGWSATTTRMRQ
jgi:hypothetical protein